MEACITQGIVRVRDIWKNHIDDQDFHLWDDKEWWERFGPEVEVERLGEILDNKWIINHPGSDKLRWGYNQKGSSTMKEAYDVLIEANIQSIDKKWGNRWKMKLWPCYHLSCT